MLLRPATKSFLWKEPFSTALFKNEGVGSFLINYDVNTAEFRTAELWVFFSYGTKKNLFKKKYYWTLLMQLSEHRTHATDVGYSF